MKKYLLFVILIFQTACGDKTAVLSENDKNALQQILDANQEIHQILFKSDSATPSLKKVTEGVSAFSPQDPVLANFSRDLKESVNNVPETDRKSFIIAYSSFSIILAKTIKVAGLEGKYNQFYCPMEERTWVSSGLKIENPYAPDMRDCGEIIQE